MFKSYYPYQTSFMGQTAPFLCLPLMPETQISLIMSPHSFPASFTILNFNDGSNHVFFAILAFFGGKHINTMLAWMQAFLMAQAPDWGVRVKHFPWFLSWTSCNNLCLCKILWQHAQDFGLWMKTERQIHVGLISLCQVEKKRSQKAMNCRGIF